MNAAAVERVGIKISKILVIGNIDMFYHPKYYKELRKRNKSDQTISLTLADGCNGSVRSGPGLKRQATSAKLREQQASGGKLQAPSCKDQASSHKLQVLESWTLEKVSSTFDQGSLLR